MARSSLDPPVGRTTLVASVHLLDRMGAHVRRNHDTQNEFISRAIVNQMEREGDFSIRQEMEAEGEDDDE